MVSGRGDGGAHEQTAVKRKEQVQQRIKEKNGAAAAIIHYKLNTLDNNEIVFQGTSLHAASSHKCGHLLPVYPCACVPEKWTHQRLGQANKTKEENDQRS